jgi:protein-tyrosine phosphatase
VVDLHSHLLPNIDDGSQSTEQSIEVLDQFAAQGITDVVLTPHVRASDLVIDPEDVLEQRAVAFELLERDYRSNQRPSEAPGCNLWLGFEIMVDQPLPVEILADRRFSLAESRYYLIEFYMSIASASVPVALEAFKDIDATPVVAHPERYGTCSSKAICSWRDLGAKMLVDATTLTRHNPRGAKARQILAGGCADAVAADNHGDYRTMTTAVSYLESHGFGDVARMLTRENTRAILVDGELSPVPAAVIKEGVWSKFKNIIGA